MTIQINGRNLDLSDREAETLKLIAGDYQNKQIAQALKLSVKTVEKHRQSLMKKTGLHSAVLLTHFAISRGVVVNKFAKEPNG